MKKQKIAEKYSIPQIAFENFEEELKSTDILIVATGASHPIIHQNIFQMERNIGDRPFYSE